MLKAIKRVVVICTTGLTLLPSAYAAVSVSTGEPMIPNGEATHEQDITIKNEHLAFAIAVGSAAPWGVPRGALVDLATIENGHIGDDRVAFADFIPNNWSAWPNQGNKVSIIESSSDIAVVEITRDFGNIDITTRYTLRSGSDTIELSTMMTNQGDESVSLQSGFTIWPDSGHMFPVPGSQQEGASRNDMLSDRTIAYDRDWAFALHAPYFERNTYGGRDMYQSHQLAAGASQTFDAYLQVVPRGDIAPIVAAEAGRRNEATGNLSGELTNSDGDYPENGMVIVYKDNQLYAWTMAQDGHYSIDLPVGNYSVYGAATGHANSEKKALTLESSSEHNIDFVDLKGPGTLALQVKQSSNSSPLDARITLLEGQLPPVEFLDKRTFFTELQDIGRANIPLPPGNYKISVDAGAGFVTHEKILNVTLESGRSHEQNARIEMITSPSKHNWFGADLHHHGDILEAITPPETVVRSQLAAGLDLIFLSEHDSTANFGIYAELAEKRDIPFIPSIEVSPSWAHMNPFPLDLDAQLTVDPGTDDIHTLIDAMRDMGAEVIPMNHPFNEYGYYTNIANDSVPGGETDDFDLIELNSSADDAKTLRKAYTLWDQGETMYLTAGTDTHDAWNQVSGSIRMMGYVDVELTPLSFAQALKAGHGFATQGPMLYPNDTVFGESVAPAESWSTRLVAANGLKQLRVIGTGGEVLRTVQLNDDGYIQERDYAITIPADATGWVAFELEDEQGKTAWTNPLWISH